MVEFVNPYNFVPLPGKVIRRSPWWHTGPEEDPTDGTLYSGILDVEWTMLSPLLIPDGSHGDQMVLPDGRVRLPGSSVKGVVRALHEAMFNGCLRVFDSEFLPGYRMSPQSPKDVEAKDWTLGLVTKSQDGTPTEFQLGKSVEWVKASSLVDALGFPPTTGDLLKIRGSVERNVEKAPDHHRDQIVVNWARRISPQREVSKKLTAGDARLSGRVVLITDPALRESRKNKKKIVHPAWWASSELTQERVEVNRDDECDKEMLLRFRQASDGTNDRRVLMGEEKNGKGDAWRRETKFQDVRQFDQCLGRRARQSGLLFPGDVVWVKIRRDPDRVRCEEILLAQIWRKPGRHPAGERVPGELLPCVGHDNLCLSCATFGSADDIGEESGHGSNSGYAGHVRFSSVTSIGPVEIKEITRAAMSSPRPGSGMFYIDRPEPINDPSKPGDVASEWGSEGDFKSPIRGRKFFWHSDPDAQSGHWQNHGATAARPRYVAADGQPMTAPARIAKPGANAVLRGTVTFDRLPWYAVQALLAAIDPRRLPDRTRQGVGSMLATHLGGGRPLGLGSASVSLTGLITTVTGRYTGGAHVHVGDEMGMEALKQILLRVGTVGSTWERLLRLLDWDGLGAHKHLVAYPPGQEWDQFGTKEFAQSFRFFERNNGRQVTSERRRYTPLLDAAAPSQVLGRD